MWGTKEGHSPYDLKLLCRCAVTMLTAGHRAGAHSSPLVARRRGGAAAHRGGLPAAQDDRAQVRAMHTVCQGRCARITACCGETSLLLTTGPCPSIPATQVRRRSTLCPYTLPRTCIAAHFRACEVRSQCWHAPCSLPPQAPRPAAAGDLPGADGAGAAKRGAEGKRTAAAAFSGRTGCQLATWTGLLPIRVAGVAHTWRGVLGVGHGVGTLIAVEVGHRPVLASPGGFGR